MMKTSIVLSVEEKVKQKCGSFESGNMIDICILFVYIDIILLDKLNNSRKESLQVE